ncbi:MAG: hypothetical protein AB7I19_00750 [Planctomycetota bacterium]
MKATTIAWRLVAAGAVMIALALAVAAALQGDRAGSDPNAVRVAEHAEVGSQGASHPKEHERSRPHVLGRSELPVEGAVTPANPLEGTPPAEMPPVAAGSKSSDEASEDGIEEALAWIRESWRCDEFARWVLENHPVSSDSAYAISESDARFAHECATFALSGVYRTFLLSDRFLRESETEIQESNYRTPRQKEAALAHIRSQSDAYIALFSMLPSIQSKIESGEIVAKIRRVSLTSGRFPDKVGAKVNVVDIDVRARMALFAQRSGSWEVSFLIPAQLFDSVHRERLFPLSGR